MDRSLRELGIGDLGVPKRMKQVGEAFYGRSRVYAEAIAAADETALASALRRNVLKDAADEDAALPLARYVPWHRRRGSARFAVGAAHGTAAVPRPGSVRAEAAAEVGA